MNDDNVEIVGMVNLDICVENIKSKLYDVLKSSTYPEIIKYIELLPKKFENEEHLFCWGYSYINEYYKKINILDKFDSPEMEEMKYKLYILYLKEFYSKIILTYDEFLTFSRLLNITFYEYNPNRIRERDKKPYKSGDKEVDDKVNKIAWDCLHSPKPHAYEITKYKLTLLLDILNDKKIKLMDEEFNKIDLDDGLLNSILSEKRIKKLKKEENNF